MMSAKHDDAGGYPHDCYPDRRKVADRRERDRVEADRRLGLGRDRDNYAAAVMAPTKALGDALDLDERAGAS